MWSFVADAAARAIRQSVELLPEDFGLCEMKGVRAQDKLLKTLGDFTSHKNWDKFFKLRSADPVENSELWEKLYDVGFKRITNIDFSKVVVVEMLRKHLRSCLDMLWRVINMTNMPFLDGSFMLFLRKEACFGGKSMFMPYQIQVQGLSGAIIKEKKLCNQHAIGEHIRYSTEELEIGVKGLLLWMLMKYLAHLSISMEHDSASIGDIHKDLSPPMQGLAPAQYENSLKHYSLCLGHTRASDACSCSKFGKKKSHVENESGLSVMQEPKNNLKVDCSYLASLYHGGMIVRLIILELERWVSSGKLVKMVIIGLGVDFLRILLHELMPFLKIEAVELDPVVVDLTRQNYAFIDDE
eukprot:Gb_04414 [translate_table: standard]